MTLRPAVLLLSSLALAVAAPAVAQVGPPTQFMLYENDPDPFCGDTVIRMDVPQAAYVRLEVRTPDDQDTVRLLVEDMLMAGVHTIVWDGRDDSGVLLSDDAYPYRMTAAVAPGAPLLFEETKTATLHCAAAAELATWGVIKALYQ